MKSFKRLIACITIAVTLIASVPVSGLAGLQISDLFVSKAIAAGKDQKVINVDQNSDEVYEDGWTYTPSDPEITLLEASDSEISKNEIEVTVKATDKYLGEKVVLPGATVNLYVGAELKSSTVDTDNDGIVKVSLADLSQEDLAKATISAYKKVAEGKAMDGTARDSVYNALKNSDGDIIRYEYELHSEKIDKNGNWLGEKIENGEKADIVFVIDATGSMGPYIASVKNNIASFSEKLVKASMDIRFSIIEYRDTTCNEETVVHTFSGSKWTSKLTTMTDKLTSINATGGGDTNETPIEALGTVCQSGMNWRSDARKFAFLFTDAGYKTVNPYGYGNLTDLANDLKAKDICTSVITGSGYSSTYNALYSYTGGIYANLSSSFSSSMNDLAERILSVTKKKMELTLKEPRIKYNLAVCYFADDENSKSEDYRNKMKSMLKEYADDIAQTTDGHAFINKVYLFSTDNRLNFFDTSQQASMADLQIQTKEEVLEEDDDKGLNNITIHSNAYVNGYYYDQTVGSNSSISSFKNLDNSDSYKNRNTFYRIQMSAVEGAGWNNSFNTEKEQYATTVTHESGHYIFGFYDEYGYYNNSGNFVPWGTDGVERPDGILFGLMDNQHTDIEMSKRTIDYKGLECLTDKTRENSPGQFFKYDQTCEDKFADLITNGNSGLSTLSMGNYKAEYTKVKPDKDGNASDRRASYSSWFNITYVTGGSGRSAAPIRLSGIKLAGGTVDENTFEDARALNDRISDTTYTINGNQIIFALTAQAGKNYAAYSLAGGSQYYEELNATVSGSQKLFTYTFDQDEAVQIRLVEYGTETSYFDYYLDASGMTDTGYIYSSADNTTAAYENVADETYLIHITDASVKSFDTYRSVNNSTYITAGNPDLIKGGEIYSVADCKGQIDYSSLSWFVYKNGSWKQLATDTSLEENNNVGARADLDGEGLYVLMAKNPSAVKAQAVTGLTGTPDPAVNGRMILAFDDPNPNTKYYNVFYSPEAFSAVNDSVQGQVFDAKNGRELVINFTEAGHAYYVAVEAVTETGAKSDLTFITVESKQADSDGDGIPDDYCDLYSLWGLDGEDKDIANSDDDKDGLTNLEEYKGGSDPKNPNDPVVTIPTPVDSISVSKSKNRILINTSFKISASILPVEATDQSIIWTTDAPDLVELASEGNSCTIKGIGTGTTNVYAVSNDGGYSAACEVTVYCNHDYETKWTLDQPAQMYQDGSKSHHCKICGDKKDALSIPRIYSCELGKTEYFADGLNKTPAVTVKDYAGNVLVKNKDYKLTYSSTNRKEAGSYYVTVEFMGDYSGTRALYFYLYSTVSYVRKDEATLTSLKLSWDKLNGASGYKVYRKLASATSYKLLATITGTTYTDKTIAMNKEYHYVVRPYNSNKVGTDSSYVYYSTIIDKPYSFSIYPENTGELRIYTYLPSTVGGYELYRSTSETGKYTQIKSSAYPYYYDTGLTLGKTYYYKTRYFCLVKGKKYYGEYSDVKSGIAEVKTPGYPDVYSAGEKALYVTWEPVTGVTGYEVYRSDSSYGTYTKIATTQNPYYLNKSLETDKYYYYKIAAYKTVSGKKIYSGMSNYDYARTGFVPPYDIKVVSNSLTSNTISWKLPTGAKGVELSFEDPDSGALKVLGSFTTATSYTHKNLDSSRYYYYRLRSYKVVSGSKVFSDYYYIDHKAELKQVTGVKAVNTSKDSIKLTWNKVANATIYYIYYSNSLDGYYSYIGTSETNSYELKDAVLDSRNYYKIEARRIINSNYNYGIMSKPVCNTVAIPASRIKSITNSSISSLKLTWKKVAGASSYTVYRSTSKNSGYKAVKSGLTATSFTNKKLTVNKTYYYKIKTVYKTPEGVVNYSAFSPVSSAKVRLARVTGLKAATIKSKSIKLTWKKVTDAKYYKVEQSTNGKKWKVLTTTSKTSYTAKKLKKSTTYRYRVTALNKTKKVSGKASAVLKAKTRK